MATTVKGGAQQRTSTVEERISALRASGLVGKALSFLPVSGSEEGGGSGDGGLFGFARAPSVLEALRGGGGGKKVLEERREAVRRLAEGMLIVGRVTRRLQHGLQIRLERVAEWSSRQAAAVSPRGIPEKLGSLDVRGMLEAGELRDGIKERDSAGELSRYRDGDVVQCIITKVEPHSDNIVLSMRQSRIHDSLSRSIVLGVYRDMHEALRGWQLPGNSSDYSIPTPAINCSDSAADTRRGRTASESNGESQELLNVEIDMNELLIRDPLFSNPYAPDYMREAFGVVEGGRLFGLLEGEAGQGQGSFLYLRQKQNKGWAEQSIKKGIEHANDRNYLMAVRCYNSALDLDPENADAYVALGAAHANQSKFEEACKAFEKAIRMNPKHINAQRYLEATRDKIRQRLGPMAEAVLGAAVPAPSRPYLPTPQAMPPAAMPEEGGQGTDSRAAKWAASVRKRQLVSGAGGEMVDSKVVDEILRLQAAVMTSGGSSRRDKKRDAKKKKKKKDDKKKKKGREKKDKEKKRKKKRRRSSSESGSSSSSDSDRDADDIKRSRRDVEVSSSHEDAGGGRARDGDDTPRADRCLDTCSRGDPQGT